MSAILWDVETGPAPEEYLRSILPPFDPSEVKCGNIKDPKLIAEKIAKAESEHWTSFVDTAALDATRGRVLAIGTLEGGKFDWIGGDEKEMLFVFWKQLERDCIDMGHDFIGFCIHRFDLPFLIRRSWKLGVSVPKWVRSNGRYWHESLVDLAEVWKLGDYQETKSLNTLAKHFGVGEKNGNGKDFAALWESDRPKALDYLRNDLLLTQRVAERMGFDV